MVMIVTHTLLRFLSLPIKWTGYILSLHTRFAGFHPSSPLGRDGGGLVVNSMLMGAQHIAFLRVRSC